MKEKIFLVDIIIEGNKCRKKGQRFTIKVVCDVVVILSEEAIESLEEFSN